MKYTGYVIIGTAHEPDTFDFEARDDMTAEELELIAKEALWESGVIDWWYVQQDDAKDKK